ncbi:MAG: hypothetical protein NTX59_09390 [Elusimicrobia bacterium]|nr:hypothetical protein [Elusimicrobiota bacterium]
MIALMLPAISPQRHIIEVRAGIALRALPLRGLKPLSGSLRPARFTANLIQELS